MGAGVGSGSRSGAGLGLKRRGLWRPGVVVVAAELEVDLEQQVGEVLHPEPVALEQLVETRKRCREVHAATHSMVNGTNKRKRDICSSYGKALRSCAAVPGILRCSPEARLSLCRP